MSADTPNPDSPLVDPASQPTKPADTRKRRTHFKTGLKRDRSLRPTVVVPDVVDAEIISRKALKKQVTASAPLDGYSSSSRGQIIRRAREMMIAQSEFYVRSHIEAVQKALKSDDSRALETARRASEWALENISDEKERIIQPRENSPATMPTIQIGIALGGLPANDRKQLASKSDE